MDSEHYQFCQEIYHKEYETIYHSLCDKHHAKPLSRTLIDEFDREAQKAAIRISFTKAMQRFTELPVAELWNSIYRAHLFRKSGISDIDTINKVISADQSWKKSSGHAFEEMIKELANLTLSDTNVATILQRDLNTLIKAGELGNEPRDISWLKEQIKANIFDLYSIVNVDSKKYCFGCIQAKTSIRDRVTRDREPSIHAMQSFFWSVVFVLDGDFLRLPKFVNMINGGSKEFNENGWHGMYVLSAKDTIDRIYPLSMDFAIFRQHALIAAEQWLKRRQWLDTQWRAE